jgi:thiosulfate dehydrogenase
LGYHVQSVNTREVEMGRGIIVGCLLTLVVLAAGAYIYFGMGLAPVATSAQPMPFEKFLAHKALHVVAGKAASMPSPVDASETNLKKGAMAYRENCAVCHGLPGQAQTDIAQGMFPEPPQLFHGKGVTDDPVGETFWKVQNGIRLSGMPAFKNTMTDMQMWQVSELLAHADKLPASVKDELDRGNQLSVRSSR